MKILFDHQAFTNQKYGGISRYFANLHYGLNGTANVTSRLGLLFTHNAYIEKSCLPFGGLVNSLVKKQSRRNKYNKWYGRYLLQQGNFDVFHPTYYHPYFLAPLQKPFVLTVHDMIHELYPHYFAAQDPFTAGYKAEVINRANHIIAISECTKRDLQKFYPIPDDKITVVHHGFKMNDNAATGSASKIEGNYLLFVGDRSGYKNFKLFVKAVAPLLSDHNLQLVCSGGGSFKASELELFNSLNITHRVQQMSTTDNELTLLYSHAEAFIYPSRYEGFGLPVLEALNNNCPVILSNTSSLPEVGGDAALYFDPDNQNSITNAVEKIINNKTLANEFRSRGKQRLKLFDFENTLKQTINVYKRVMQQ